MDSIDLSTMVNSPAEFRNALLLPTGTGERWYSECVAPFQLERYAALDPSLVAVAKGEYPPIGRFWWEATKGASKDTDLAISLLWLLAFTTRPLTCQVGAADQDQADELRKAAKGIVHRNPWLAQVIRIQNSTIVCEATGSNCEIVAADVTGSHGARPDVLILNELTHVAKQEFAANLMDNATKVPRGLVVIATNAGLLESWQWDWRELARTSDRWSFHKLAEPAPWLDQAELAEARIRNPHSRYLRLWEGVWVADAGDAIDEGDIKAAMTAPGPMRGCEPDFTFLAGLDLGVKRDHCGLVVLGNDHLRRRVRLAECKSWAPPKGGMVDLIDVAQTVANWNRQFGFYGVLFDPSQAHLMGQLLRREGVPMIEVPQTGPELRTQATALIEGFRNQRIDLWDCGPMLRDLRRLRLVERSYGIRIEAPRSAADGHCDLGSAFAIALPSALSWCQHEILDEPGEVIAVAV